MRTLEQIQRDLRAAERDVAQATARRDRLLSELRELRDAVLKVAA